MFRIRFRPLAAAAVAVVAVGIAACGGDHVPKAIPDSGATLEGTVKVGSDQLYYAMITAKGGVAVTTGKIDEDGKYKLTNVPIGEVQVAVNTAAARGDHQSAMMAAGAMTGGPEGKTGRKKVNVTFIDIKELYYDPGSSGVKTTVNGGANTFNIELPASARK